MTPFYFCYFPILDDQFAVKYLTTHHVDNMSFYVLHNLTSYLFALSFLIFMKKIITEQRHVMALVMSMKIPSRPSMIP